MKKKTIALTLLSIAILTVGILLLKENKVKHDLSGKESKKQAYPIKENLLTTELIDNQQNSPIPSEENRAVVDKIRPVVRIDTVNITPPSLTVIMGEGLNKNYFTRIKEVHKLGRNLSYAEIQTLFAMLNRKKGQDNLSFSKLNGIKNDVVNLLKRQESLPIDLSHNLMSMYYDKEHDNVWRDYCIQHLGAIYKKADKKNEIAETLWDAVKETKLSIAGTALIALSYNCDEIRIKKTDVAEKALEVSTAPAIGELARITAFQICAKLGEKQVLPTVRRIASSETSVPLRMSSIAAIGTLGNEYDRDILNKYINSSDIRLRKSAQSALERLKQK